jgi:hypothetical protein
MAQWIWLRDFAKREPVGTARQSVEGSPLAQSASVTRTAESARAGVVAREGAWTGRDMGMEAVRVEGVRRRQRCRHERTVRGTTGAGASVRSSATRYRIDDQIGVERCSCAEAENEYTPQIRGRVFEDPKEERRDMPDKRPSVKNEDQYEGLKEKGMSKARAARIANSPGASSRGGNKSGSETRRRTTSQGGTSAQKKAAGRKGGEATARKRSS